MSLRSILASEGLVAASEKGVIEVPLWALGGGSIRPESRGLNPIDTAAMQALHVAMLQKGIDIRWLDTNRLWSDNPAIVSKARAFINRWTKSQPLPAWYIPPKK